MWSMQQFEFLTGQGIGQNLLSQSLSRRSKAHQKTVNPWDPQMRWNVMIIASVVGGIPFQTRHIFTWFKCCQVTAGHVRNLLPSVDLLIALLFCKDHSVSFIINGFYFYVFYYSDYHSNESFCFVPMNPMNREKNDFHSKKFSFRRNVYSFCLLL